MPSDDELPVNVDRRGTSIDDAVAFYEGVYSSDNMHVGRPATHGFSWRFRAVGDDDVAVGTSSVAANRWGTVGQQDVYMLAWATGPGLTLDSAARSPIQMLPGTPVMYPSDREFEFEARPTTQHLIRFDKTFLESVAAAHAGTIPGPLQFTTTAKPAAAARLREVIRSASPELLNPATDGARRAALNMLVAEAVVDAYDATPMLEIIRYEGPASMRLAQEWMIANAHRPITVTDVARAVGINSRGLQANFQRHAGESPLSFLRSVRLHRVRAQLVAAEPDATTVAEIARRWGFGHLGRFAAYYANAFGELPSETLRRR